MNAYRSINKYRAKKAVVEGITFDSKREAGRYIELRLLESKGIIKNLRIQVPYLLIPAQYELSDEVYKRGNKKGQRKPGKIIEREVKYIADFVYEQDGETIVEDSKGFRPQVYNLKRKLMLYVHGIRIKEV